MTSQNSKYVCLCWHNATPIVARYLTTGEMRCANVRAGGEVANAKCTPWSFVREARCKWTLDIHIDFAEIMASNSYAYWLIHTLYLPSGMICQFSSSKPAPEILNLSLEFLKKYIERFHSDVIICLRPSLITSNRWQRKQQQGVELCFGSRFRRKRSLAQ